MREKLNKLGRFLLNPHLVICFVLAWLITNGWAYIALGLGSFFGIRWLIIIGGGYVAFLWFPFTPEKIVTVAICILFLKLFFPGDKQTLGVLEKWWGSLKGNKNKSSEDV